MTCMKRAVARRSMSRSSCSSRMPAASRAGQGGWQGAAEALKFNLSGGGTAAAPESQATAPDGERSSSPRGSSTASISITESRKGREQAQRQTGRAAHPSPALTWRHLLAVRLHAGHCVMQFHKADAVVGRQAQRRTHPLLHRLHRRVGAQLRRLCGGGGDAGGRAGGNRAGSGKGRAQQRVIQQPRQREPEVLHLRPAPHHTSQQQPAPD